LVGYYTLAGYLVGTIYLPCEIICVVYDVVACDVVDGFLYIGKGDVRTVRSAECTGRGFLQFLFHCCKIAFGKDAVGIQYNQVFSPAAFGTVIARLSGTGVGLGVVTDVQNVLIALCNVLAGNRRTVLYDK
jgi:hypothetical protein